MEQESSEMERREIQRNEPVQRGYFPLELFAEDLAKTVIAKGYLFNATAYNEDWVAYPVYDPKGDSIGFLVRSEPGKKLSVWMREKDMDTFRRMFPPPANEDSEGSVG